jgi:hypothetical protein
MWFEELWNNGAISDLGFTVHYRAWVQGSVHKFEDTWQEQQPVEIVIGKGTSTFCSHILLSVLHCCIHVICHSHMVLSCQIQTIIFWFSSGMLFISPPVTGYCSHLKCEDLALDLLKIITLNLSVGNNYHGNCLYCSVYREKTNDGFGHWCW